MAVTTADIFLHASFASREVKENGRESLEKLMDIPTHFTLTAMLVPLKVFPLGDGDGDDDDDDDDDEWKEDDIGDDLKPNRRHDRIQATRLCRERRSSPVML